MIAAGCKFTVVSLELSAALGQDNLRRGLEWRRCSPAGIRHPVISDLTFLYWGLRPNVNISAHAEADEGRCVFPGLERQTGADLETRSHY